MIRNDIESLKNQTEYHLCEMMDEDIIIEGEEEINQVEQMKIFCSIVEGFKNLEIYNDCNKSLIKRHIYFLHFF